MRRMIAVGIALAVFLLAGCSGSEEVVQQTTTEGTLVSSELVEGYTGGCEEGFAIFVQHQFVPFGTMIRRDLAIKGESIGLKGNEELKAVGWTRTEHVFYPENPPELRGTVWFYIPELPNGAGSGWVPDAGVRAVKTEPAPTDENEHFDAKTQAVPLLPECELIPR